MLTQLTSAPSFYRYLYLAVFLLAAFNIAEIIFLLLYKLRLERSEARKELHKSRIAAAIITSTEPAEMLPAPLHALEYEAYSEAIAGILENFKGEIAERAVRLANRLKVDSYYKRMASSSVWYKRAYAIDILSSLRLANTRAFLITAFRKESSTAVKYRIIYGLSLLCRTHADISAVSKMLCSIPYLTAKYTEDIFLNAISALEPPDRESEYDLFLRKVLLDKAACPLMKRDCISACRTVFSADLLKTIKKYYAVFMDEPEIQVACIRSLSLAGDFELLPEALGSAYWSIRLAALKHAHLCAPVILPELRSLLHDSNYHVRINAALALSRFKEPGLEILRAEAGSGEKFAAEAAGYGLSSAEAGQ